MHVCSHDSAQVLQPGGGDPAPRNGFFRSLTGFSCSGNVFPTQVIKVSSLLLVLVLYLADQNSNSHNWTCES